MYLPKPKKVEKANPLKITMSRRYLIAIGNMVVIGSLLGAYHLMGVVQNRRRTSDAKFEATRDGKKVIIVGGGAAGCTVASALTNQDPTLQVVVFEPQRHIMLQSMVPLAHVGHRSYDLCTHDGHDSLFSPTTWNVTRDAKLVFRSVERVFPQERRLVDSDGDEHSYDCLVIATGTRPDFAAVPGLTEASYNKFRIAQDPGVTRDTLGNMFQGLVVHAKIPPRTPEKLFEACMHEAVSKHVEAIAVAAASRRPWWKRLLGGAKNPSPLSTEASAVPAVPSPSTTMRESTNIVPDTASFIGQQHCGTFVSTTNTIWKYLDYFRKDQLCPLIAVSSEREPADLLPSDYNNVIRELWGQRKVHFMGRTLVDAVRPHDHVCVLRNADTGATSEHAFRLLVLDIPRRVSGWIAQSGLSKPSLGGFVNVDPVTLQHREHSSIFAIGDCAAVPTVSSYGAVFAQAPVVAHNVLQCLRGRQPNAAYDGYSSFNIVMSTWRHMWPEMGWAPRPLVVDQPTPPPSAGVCTNSAGTLQRRNAHYWDNTKWRDVRGLLQGAYVQWFGLETMHWFVFLRANWFPPNWFQLPLYGDGAVMGEEGVSSVASSGAADGAPSAGGEGQPVGRIKIIA